MPRHEDPQRTSADAPTPVRQVAAVLAVAVAALALGALTSPAQGFLPSPVNSFANSAGGWTMIAFALVFTARARVVLSALLGLVAFVLLVEGYRIGSELRGLSYSEPFRDFYTYVGAVTGPLVGACAAILRSGRDVPWRALAISPISALLIGEGIYGLTVIARTTSPVYWTLEVVIGVAAVGYVLWRLRTPRSWAAATIMLTLAGAVAFRLLATMV